MQCECDKPGFCERHNCYKSKELHEQCKMCPSCFKILEKDNKLPNIVTRSVNYIVSEIKHTYYGRKEVPEEVYNKRMSICSSCPLFQLLDKICTKCGCYMEIKAKWVDSECPIGEWKSEIENEVKKNGCSTCGH